MDVIPADDMSELGSTYVAMCTVAALDPASTVLRNLCVALQHHAYSMGRERGAADVAETLKAATDCFGGEP